MTPAQKELAHLLSLLRPPYTEGFKAFCWHKAMDLAESEPQEYSELPEMLKQAMRSESKSGEITTETSPSSPSSSS